MNANKHPDEDRVGTTGHEWDGIQELNNPLPRWWLYIFYATVVWAVGYAILYPSWPGIDDATKGVLGWSSRAELARDVENAAASRAGILRELEATPIEQLPANPRLMGFAVEGGKSAFKVNCAQCHGSGAAGFKGYPNLNDDDWLWGGSIAEIHTTLRHGIRSPDDEQTRTSMMPAFGRDGMLTEAQIGDVVEHVRRVSRQSFDLAREKRGAQIFAEQCAACHGADAGGNRQLGAPNLTDAIWLYGGDRETLARTVHGPRGGVMPAWEKRLDPAMVKQLAAYVHSLGGGE